MVRTRGKKILILSALAWMALPGICLAASTTISVSATILSKSNCKFKSNSAALVFGNLDPLAHPDVTVQTTIGFVCNGADDPATYIIVDDDGLHETGPDANRMQHGTMSTAFIPYSFSLAPASGTVPKGVVQTLTVTGTVLGTDYQTALAGSYTDTVVITLNP